MGIQYLLTVAVLSLAVTPLFGVLPEGETPGLLPDPIPPQQQQTQPQQPQAQQQYGPELSNAIVAVVEDRVITLGEVRSEISLLLPQLQREARTQQEFHQRLRALEDEVVQNLVDRVLIVKKFEEEGYQIPQSFVEGELKDIITREFGGDRHRFLQFLNNQGHSIREFRQQLEEQIIVRYMRGQMERSESIVSPARIEEFYAEKKDDFYREESVYLRLIQLRPIASESDDVLLQTAEKIDREMKDGADFAELAAQYSQGRNASNGGSWDWIKTRELREEWREVVADLNKGEHSEPLQSGDDLYILYVEDRREAGIPPIHEVRDQIETILASQMAREAQQRWLERLRRNAYVRLYM